MNARLSAYFSASAILSCLALSACLVIQPPASDETPAPSATPAPTQEPTAQPTTDPTLAPTALPANVFFDDFDAPIDESAWEIATWTEHNGQTGRDRCFAKDGYLTLQFVNPGSQPYLSSAIQTRDSFLYGTWEYRAKCPALPKILSSFYTIDWGGGDGTKQEIDIEFLTKSFGSGSGQVHYAVHEDGKSSWATNPDVNLGFNPSDGFHVYAFDIGRERIRWLVDGVEKKRYDYASSAIAIDAPYQLKLNLWSSTSSWVGGPPASGVTATYLIDWIKFTPAE